MYCIRTRYCLPRGSLEMCAGIWDYHIDAGEFWNLRVGEGNGESRTDPTAISHLNLF